MRRRLICFTLLTLPLFGQTLEETPEMVGKTPFERSRIMRCERKPSLPECKKAQRADHYPPMSGTISRGWGNYTIEWYEVPGGRIYVVGGPSPSIAFAPHEVKGR